MCIYTILCINRQTYGKRIPTHTKLKRGAVGAKLLYPDNTIQHAGVIMGLGGYGRTHADGANMLAEAVEPYGGLIIWRCFVYNCKQEIGRAHV